MTKSILIEYCEMKEEIKELKKRIEVLEKQIDNLCIVSDSVKGTRADGTIGSIKISGYPMVEYERKMTLLNARKAKLKHLEIELLELTNQAEEFINKIKKSELRMMFRLYYIDGMTWSKVAINMNHKFPNRKRVYTEDSCKKKHQRFWMTTKI